MVEYKNSIQIRTTIYCGPYLKYTVYCVKIEQMFIRRNSNMASKRTITNNFEKQVEKGSNTTDNRISNQKYCYDLVNSWINNADSKITVATSVSVGLFSVITYVSEQISITHYTYPSIVYIFMYYLYTFFPIIGFILLLVSLYFYSRALVPNLKSNDDNHNKDYPLFFGDISKLDLKKYKKKMLFSTDADFLEELINETHNNSKLCSKKMKRFRLGFILSIISVVLAFLTLGIKYFLSM